MPPGRSDFSECDQVASPTVSITASTRSGSRAPVSKAASRAELHRPRALRLVAAGDPDPQPGRAREHDQRRRDAAAGTRTRTVSPGSQPGRVNSIR